MKLYLIAILSFLPCAASIEPVDIVAIREYWLTRHPVKPPELSASMPSFGIERVTGTSFLQNLRHHRLYTFKERSSDHSGYAVVSVDDHGAVQLVESVDDFNRLMSSEAIRITGKKDVSDLARTFLRIHYFSGVKLWGWEVGVNVVKTINDIPFGEDATGKTQRQVLEATVVFTSPRIETDNGRFRYSLLTWSPVSGDLDRMEVVIENDKVLAYTTETLAKGIGVHGGY